MFPTIFANGAQIITGIVLVQTTRSGAQWFANVGFSNGSPIGVSFVANQCDAYQYTMRQALAAFAWFASRGQRDIAIMQLDDSKSRTITIYDDYDYRIHITVISARAGGSFGIEITSTMNDGEDYPGIGVSASHLSLSGLDGFVRRTLPMYCNEETSLYSTCMQAIHDMTNGMA